MPGLESSNNNKEEEDVFYNEMMRAVLRIVMRPLLVPSFGESAPANSNTERASLSVSELNRHFADILGGWEYVKEASVSAASDCHPQAETFKNLFRWKAFTKKNRASVMVL